MDKINLEEFRNIDMNPFDGALKLISGKWKMNLLFCLSEFDTMRYGEIKKTLGSITPHVLSVKLRELEANELIERHEYPQVPPKVEYTLTDKGRTLIPILRSICDWGKEYCVDFQDKQE